MFIAVVFHRHPDMQKFESFRNQILDFQKFAQKCVTHNILNLAEDWMISKILEDLVFPQ